MSLRSENRQLFVRLAVVAAGMFGFGYDKPDAAPLNTQVDTTRTVTIELDSNTHKIAWRFRPLVSHVSVHPGELTTVEYEVVNTRPTAVTGQAVASYGPQFAGEYFKKLQCFCFTQQTLAAGETRRMPVSFIVDPRLPRDVTSIALSYTFFEVDGRGGKS
jgi:cytochrome c oxidase assembly protein subunit 11